MQTIFFRNWWVQSLVFLEKGKTESFLFKTIEPYMQSVHVLIILLFFVRKTVSLNLIVSKFFTNNIV